MALLHVAGYNEVHLVGGLTERWFERACYAKALIESSISSTFFGKFIGLEEFIIGIQSKFVQDENTAAILKIVGNITDSTVTTFADDGVTQQVTAKTGIAKVENVALPNPVTLRPYRTFLELEQPASQFVFRMRQGVESPSAGLFEADGGMWKHEAMQKIKAWLETNIPGVAVLA